MRTFLWVYGDLVDKARLPPPLAFERARDVYGLIPNVPAYEEFEVGGVWCPRGTQPHPAVRVTTTAVPMLMGARHMMWPGLPLLHDNTCYCMPPAPHK